MDHIDAMDQLKNGIGLRAYGQHDPVIEYQNEGMDMFDEMNYNIKSDTDNGSFQIFHWLYIFIYMNLFQCFSY